MPTYRTTANLQLRTPSGAVGEAPDGPGSMATLADDIDAFLGAGGAERAATAAALSAIPAGRLFAGKRAYVAGLGGGLFLRYTGTAWFVEGPVDRMTAAQRAAIPTTYLWDGYTVTETDTLKQYTWNTRTAGWIVTGAAGHAAAGFRKIVPTSVGGGTIDSNGDAVGTAAAALQLNGVLDWSTCLRYRIIVAANSNTVSGTSLYLRGSFAGVAETGTTFWTWLAHRNLAGTGSDTMSANTDAAQLTPPFNNTNQNASADLMIFKQYNTARMQGEVTGGVSAQSASAQQTSHIDYGTNKDWTTMDGFQISAGTGTASIRVSVYALE